MKGDGEKEGEKVVEEELDRGRVKRVIGKLRQKSGRSGRDTKGGMEI